VKNRLFSIIESLRTKIVTVYGGVETMVSINRKLALGSLFGALYFPYGTMEPLFEAFSDLENGDGLKLYNFYGNLTVTCQDCDPSTVSQAGNELDASYSIQCTDSGATSDDLAYLRSIYNTLAAQTYLADVAFFAPARCM